MRAAPSRSKVIKRGGQGRPLHQARQVSKIMAMLRPNPTEETVFVETLVDRIGPAFVVTSGRLLHSAFLVVVTRVRG